MMLIMQSHDNESLRGDRDIMNINKLR